jgi:signal transduction histidine kinase/DNA-binding response OmpR family regulator
LKYLNKVKTSEGEKELVEKISLAEKEKKIDLERVNAKNEVEFQGYLTAFGFGIALLILGIAIYIFFAYKTKSKLANDLLLAYNNNEQLKKEKDNFLAYTSHEIRTPLSAVLTASEILDDSTLDKKQKEHLKTLRSSANSILFLVNDILDLAKLEKRKITLEKIPFSPDEVIRNAIKILASKAYNNSVEVTFKTQINTPDKIIGDSFRFQQIIINLLDNAIKYSPNGLVNIVLDLKSNNFIEVSIKDNGKGIEKEKLNHIFKPYTQEKSNTSRQYGGTGLGLAICDLLIQLMKGNIGVESNAKGSNFSFTIPYVEAKNSVRRERLKLKELNILMVEDDLVNGQLFKDMITNKENNVLVHWAKNGVEALSIINKIDFNIVLMDLEMPLKNGYETSQEIRKLSEINKSSIPIIAMTAHVLDKVLDKCYENGINDCIAKPFQLDVLQKKIMSLTNINSDTNEKTIDKAKYIGLYIKSFDKDFKLLKSAVHNKESKEVKYLLHKMKGSALTMEFDDLADLFLQMEQKKLVALEKSLEKVKTLFEKNSKTNL